MAKFQEKHGMSRSDTYRSWQNMKARCTRPSCQDYASYGGRGVTVHRAWLDSFAAFLADMGACPPGLTLERINNQGNYEPDNCKWASRSEQQRNKRAKTVCKNGHPFTAANTYWRTNGGRTCRACNVLAVKKYQAKEAA